MAGSDTGGTSQYGKFIFYRQTFVRIIFSLQLFSQATHFFRMYIFIILRQIFFPLYREVSLIVSIIGKLLYHQGLKSPARRDNITDQRDLIFL